MSARKYKVNEIFYSVQAEGRNAGRAAVFVRFSGCNLSCPFCDTDHESFREMTREEIEAEVNRLSERADLPEQVMVVFTGGEPTLQLTDEEPFCRGRFRAVETNGMLRPPCWIDWVTVSPKEELSVPWYDRADEIKFVYGSLPDEYLLRVEAATRVWSPFIYVQPMADASGKFDLFPALDFTMRHPLFRLSIQFHKLFSIP